VPNLHWLLVGFYSTGIMSYDPKFGPNAQTPEQRAYVLRQLQSVNPSLKNKATAYAQELYSRYIDGELSWLRVRELLDMAAGRAPRVY
jgi:hypothetical protein